MKNIKLLFLTGLLFLFISGIYRHDTPVEQYLSLAKESRFDCVGQILTYQDNKWKKGASCVFIGDKFVLSAVHVFIETDTTPDTMQINGQTVIVYVPYNERIADISKLFFMFNGIKYKGKRLIIHPNYLDSLTKGSCDIALIELEKEVKGISFPFLNKEFNELGDTVTGVGFGVSGLANRPDLVGPYGLKIAGQNIIDSIGGYQVNNNRALLFADFDSPIEYEGCNKMGDSKPLPLEYIPSGGDSGGGLFREKNNKLDLIGITTGSGVDLNILLKSGYYCQINSWTRISVFYEWIEQNIK